MLGSLFLFLLSLPQGGKGGEMGEKGVEKAVFYNFLNFIHSKISKKLGFKGSPFPLLSLEDGKKKRK